jgi:hypothetical protein
LDGDQPVVRPLLAHRIAQIQNKRTQTSMPQVGFEPTIPVFARAKTIHATDRAAAVIGNYRYSLIKLKLLVARTHQVNNTQLHKLGDGSTAN